MNIQIFPYRLKKIGFLFFVIGFIMSFFYKGILPGINTQEIANIETNEVLGLLNAFSGGAFTNGFSLLNIFSMFGVIIYIMAKERVEDDYINKLRLEAFQVTSLIFLISAIILYVFNRYLAITLNIIFPFIWCYVIIFFIKKRFSL